MKAVILCLISIFIFSNVLEAQDSKAKPKSLAAILNDSSMIMQKKGDTEAAFELVDKAIQQATKDQEQLSLAKAINNKGYIYLKTGDPKVALLYFEQSLDILKKMKLKPNMATSLLNLGITYKELSIYDKSLKNLFESVTYFIELKDTNQLSSAYNTIGNVFSQMRDYKQALQFLHMSLRLRQYINSPQIGGSLTNIGIAHKNNFQYDSAITYLSSALKFKSKSATKENTSNTLSSLGEIYILKGDENKALEYISKSQQIRLAFSDKAGLARSDFEFGKLYKTFGQFQKAKKYLNSCIAKSSELGLIKILAESHEMLKSIYENDGNFKLSLFHANQFQLYRDSLINDEKQKSMLSMQVKYEVESKQREIEELNIQREKNEALMQNQTLQITINNSNNILLASALIFVLILVVLMLVLYRNNKVFTKKLDMVLRDLHHRVKNNFQVLYALNNLQKNLVEEPKAKAILATNNDRIAAMMLIHKELYMDRDMTSVTLPEYIRTLVSNLLSIYEKEKDHIQFQYNLQSDLKLDADKAIVFGLLVNELVTNSLKHAFNTSIDSPTIRLDLYSPEPGKYRFIYSDNGQGLSNKEDKKTLGMNLIDNQIKLLKGSVVLQTQKGLKYDINF